jgi:hypothetical protein
MRTAIALVLLGLSSVASAQSITPATSIQVTVAGNPQFSGTVNCVYVGNGINNHVWTGALPPSSGAYGIRVSAGGSGEAFIVVAMSGILPSAPWTIRTTNLNGPTWNESAGGTNPFNLGTVTVRGM